MQKSHYLSNLELTLKLR